MRKTLLVVLLALLLAWLSRDLLLPPASESPGRVVPPVPVTVYDAQLQPFQNQIRALGTLRARESVNITASVSETLVSLHFEDGDTVASGQLLVTLQQDEELASLREQQEFLREQIREVARLEDLARKNQVAQTELDQRRTLAAIARNRIEQQKARIDDRTINAPFDGVLGLRQLSPGALVTPGQKIVSLDDVSTMRLDFTVPSNALAFLRVGQQVEANTGAYVQSFTGVLAAVDSRVDPMNRSITARANFANAEGMLKPGMLMSLTLLGEQRQSLLVPEESLVSRASEHFVWLIDGDAAVRTQILIGGRQPGWVEVSSGLSPGARVVRDGVARLRGTKAVITIVAP